MDQTIRYCCIVGYKLVCNGVSVQSAAHGKVPPMEKCALSIIVRPFYNSNIKYRRSFYER